MFQDQSRRVGRAYRWGVGSAAALALAAGTTVAQQSEDPTKDAKDAQHQVEQKDTKAFESKTEHAKTAKVDQQEWKAATTLPNSNSDVIFAGTTKDDKDVQLVFDNGRLIEATCDGKGIDKSKIQVKGDKLRVMGDDNSELITFKVHNRILASGPDMDWQQDQSASQDRFARQDGGTARDRFAQDRYAGGPFPQESTGRRSSQTWSTQQDRWTDQPQQQNRWDSQDTWARSAARDSGRDSADWNRQDAWNTQNSGRSSDTQRDSWQTRSVETTRDQQPYYRDSQDTYRDSRFESTGQQPYFRSADELRTTRMYGPTEERPIVLGIIMDEADANQLRRSSYTSGLTIVRVREGTAAQRAGLREGDMVVLIDNQPADTQVLERRLSTARSGEDVRFRVLRDGRERDIVVRAEALPEGSSIYPRDTDMPNIDQPGPFNVYRPTRPEEWEDHMGTGGRRTWDEDRRFDNDRDVYIYDRPSNTRDQTYYRQPEANWRDRNTRSTAGDRDQLNRTYYTGESDVYIDRNVDSGAYYTVPESDTRFETRTYYTGRDLDDRTMRYRGDQWPVMPNERTPGPNSNYRPTRPSVDDRDIYRPSQDRR